MIAHNPKIAQQKGLSPATAKEYVSHNTGSMRYQNLPEQAPSKPAPRRQNFKRLSKYLK